MRHIARHKSLLQLLLKIKYIEFEYRPKILIKKPVWMWKFSYDETDKRVSLQELEKTNIGRLSVKVANTIERTVMIEW